MNTLSTYLYIMKKISVLIIDDEAGAHKVLENYIGRTPGLELAGHTFNAPEALAFLKNTPVDLVFLDITMPEINGFAFLQMLKDPPLVIFTTAYSEFAAESYDYNAVDYLKKPIPFDRFGKAIDKLKRWIDKDLSPSPANAHIDLRIDVVADEQLMIGNIGLPIGKTFKKYVKELMHGY